MKTSEAITDDRGSLDRSLDSVSRALDRLRQKGEFGLTHLFKAASPTSRLPPLRGTSTAVDTELALPGTVGNELGLSLNAPVGTEVGLSLAASQGTTGSYIKPDKLLDLIEKPPKINLKEAFDPGTSSLEEIDEKSRELQYRKDWLEALLAVTREELAAFDEARKQRLLKDSSK